MPLSLSCPPGSNPREATPLPYIYRQICGDIEACLNGGMAWLHSGIGQKRAADKKYALPAIIIWLFFSTWIWCMIKTNGPGGTG
jgi:hypothetical protein